MAKETYDHQKIEPAARAKWDALKLHETDLENAKDPYYLLFEFPYPSGDLHIGHWYAFALTDIFARYQRMKGKDVLFPIGFDAFGLPAENAAIKYGKDPKEWTYQNMERMRAQIRTMGTSVDWSKEIVSCDPSYYRWTQWLFVKLYEHGLAERKEAPVKWCPKDATVLANEQVVDGRCERCGTEVEEKRLTQWFMKITAYAERLLADLDPLPWREDIKEAQRQWIGKSEGAKLPFSVKAGNNVVAVEVFTTRPDTVFGATYLVLAPEYGAISDLLDAVSNKKEVEAYIEATKRKTERERSENKEKTGVCLEGVIAVNPATGKDMPVYLADYVLASYGTGAVMAVPAHDERDAEFAKQYRLPAKVVVEGGEGHTGDGKLINSGAFDGRDNREAFDDIIVACGGEKTTNYRIRDWLVSRQRYWGCPIPIVYDPEGLPHVVPAEHLPWLLPEDVDFTPSAGASPLASSKELQERVTRIFGENWTPEYDTLDTFVDSSWYFLRYLSSSDDEKFADAALMKKWIPVDRYSGGSEHTTMHLLYARFFQKALYDLALVPTAEPFNERFNRGIILGPDGAKMSKSKGNVINPDEFVGKYGADAVRMYLAFIGPYNEPGHYPWNLSGVESMRRFLDRVYALSEKVVETDVSDTLQKAVAKANVKVATEIERFKFNTALSGLMVLVKELESLDAVPLAAWSEFLVLLAPFAPHLAEHLCEKAGGVASIHEAAWPVPLATLLCEDVVSVVVQVNGKRKGDIMLAPNASEDTAREAALALPAVLEALLGSEPSRVIYVPGRVLNIVP